MQDYDSFRRSEFERVALPHVESLLRAALNFERERARAEDLVQETMLRAWRAFDQFERGTNCKAWLFRIMLNLHSKRRKTSQAKAQEVSLESIEAKAVVRLPVFRSRPTNLEVISALESLSAEHRTVLILAVVEGFTCKEIAKMCNLPIGTVMSRLSRARAALRESLGYAPLKSRMPVCGG
jgi:RNA polymerase sigma-70 factor (ECF subfamily)